MLQVLKDPGRRRQYDAARQAASSGPIPGSGFGSDGGYGSGSGGFGTASGGGGGGNNGFGGFQPGVENEAFEEAFRKWWEKAGGKCESLLPMCPHSPRCMQTGQLALCCLRAARICLTSGRSADNSPMLMDPFQAQLPLLDVLSTGKR